MKALCAAGFGALLFLAAPLPAQKPAPSPVLEAMRVELARSLAALREQPAPPYFLGYSITEVHALSVGGSFGAVTERSEQRRRALDVEVRVGDYAFDNTHAVRARLPDFDDFGDFAGGAIEVPIDDDPAAIRAALWHQTDRKYRRAVERLSTVRANAGVSVAPDDSSPDFSREPPEHYVERQTRPVASRRAWEVKIRRYTAPFARHGEIYGATAEFSAVVETRWYVNSEGSEIQTSQPIYRLHISALAKADDGMELPRYESFFALTPEGLPDDRTVLRAVDRMIADLQALRRAPVMEAYTGPAILSGRASAVFFHEILGHRLEGHRQKLEEEAQTFRRSVNTAVLPPGFSVYFDPTLRRLGGTDLAGFYRYDDEGVRARRVAVIEGGTLKTFLMSRSPIEGFARSNGHGRRQVGSAPVARQSNLIVEVAEPRSRAELRQLLIDQIRREGKPFGLFFDDIEGGFTITMRGFPNAFEVLPIMVYRVFPDGREELVRGVDLIGTPLTVFSKVTAADGRIEVFNGLCGAESGLVPVSAASPAVFISQIEVQKKPKALARAPILAAPAEAGAGTGDVVLRAMRDELRRSMAHLRLDTLPGPYFIAYRVDEVAETAAAATRGSLVSSGEERSRLLSVEVRVGDYAFDNSNFVSVPAGAGGFLAAMGGMAPVPLDDDYRALRRQLWLATDAWYKEAVADLGRKRAAFANRTRAERIPDFTREAVVTLRDESPVPPFDRARIETLVRDLSAVLRESPEIHRSGVEWSGAVQRTWYVNSEGTSFVRTSPWVSVYAHAGTQAPDGTPLHDVMAVHGASPADLPGREALARGIRDLAARLVRLRRAPPAEVYNGPVLFEGEAAAELFSQVFAPQLLAHGTPVSDDPMFERFAGRRESALLDHVGGRVLPRFLSVTDNPTVRTHRGRFIGGYLVDDDGVRARETRVVEGGILRTLLTTRVPVGVIERSTGNRRGEGAAVSNLFVTADSGLTDEQLRRRLLALAAERGAPYAVVVRRIGNPFLAAQHDPMALFAAMGGRMGEAPTLSAAEAVRLYPDGREEPIRNGSVSGITAAMFRDIVAASRSRTVVTTPFQGGLGWFSGLAVFAWTGGGAFTGAIPAYPASYVVPSILFENVSVSGPRGDAPLLPVIPPPWATGP